MATLVLPLLSFAGCMLLHILIWRIRKPRDHAGALLAVFLIPLTVLPFLAGWFGFAASLSEWAAIFLLHAAMSMAYIQIYPASQADSPSLKVMVLVSQAMPKGLTAGEITSQFDPSRLFHDRIDDLAAVGHIVRDGDRVLLTSRGRLLIAPFFWLRRMIGLPWGKG
ncbi:MAG: hypothetical protein V1882_00440 [Candidatus Omnitrophota bacterium]